MNPIRMALGGLCCFLVGITLPTQADSGAPLKVDNFGLLDHRGRFHELYYYENDPETSAIVMFVQGNGCPLVRKRLPELARLQKAYAERGVRFCMINANPQDTREEILKEAEEFGIGMPILLDTTQLVAEALKLTRTSEVLLIEPDSWNLRYRGAISDQLDYEAAKPSASREHLVEALEALLEGRPIETAATTSPGCLIGFQDRKENTDLSYAETIAPLLEQRCVRCHTPGGIGPFAMSSYRKVSGWASMMEEVVMTGRMPPWQGDPHHGVFGNDYSMSDVEKRKLIRWIRQGAPRGEGPDPLEAVRVTPLEWALGTPDHVIHIDPQEIPAEGVLDYRYLTVKLPFEEDLWVRAVEVNPGNTRVLHHVIASIVRDAEGKKRERSLAGYAPGMGPDLLPQGTGIRIPGGSYVRFQLHYTVSGKPETDSTRLGLYFAKEPPERELKSGLVIETQFRIPPYAREYTVSKTNRIDRDILLWSMNPHMHFRGKAMSYEAIYPDGEREILLSVPHYHFNWQRNYTLAEPKRLPKGTEVVVHATWDNSSLNSYNPDPSKKVRWGEQTFNEMFFASYRYTLPGEVRRDNTANLKGR